MSKDSVVITFSETDENDATAPENRYGYGSIVGSDTAGVEISDDDDVLSGQNFELSLDAEKNTAVYGANKTAFGIRETAFLKFIRPDFLSQYNLSASIGSVRCIGTGLFYPVSDTLMFLNGQAGKLKYIPAGDPEWSWSGSPKKLLPGQVKFSGKNIALSVPATGYLTCSYRVLGDSISLSSNTAGDSIVLIVSGKSAAYQTVRFDGSSGTDPDAVPTLKSYRVFVVSLCADGVISGVTVTKNGVVIGTTDGYGEIVFESYPGTYTFAAEKTGYETIISAVTLS